jgi:phosphoserine phosphatase
VSWLDFTRQLGASVERHREIFEAYKAKQISYETSRRQLMGLWQATGRADRQAAVTLFENWPLDPAAAPLIRGLHEGGVDVALITGSFDVYAETIARRLGVKHWYANTQLIFDPAGKLETYHYVRDQSAKKLEQLMAFCRATGLAPADCLAVGDGPNDLALFTATGRGILIGQGDGRPELAELRAAAWRTVPNLSAVRDILSNEFRIFAPNR